MEKIKINKHTLLLIFILLLAAFLRLYKIGGYMTFLGDEGRDVIIVRRLLVKFDPILVGPGTSIGNMYLGPLYYYMMAPALALSLLSPVGPAIMVALLGVATVALVWLIARDWFGNIAAPIAAFLFAIAPVVIIYSRSSWNPNIMPFFATLSIYSIWKVWHNKLYKWLTITGISVAFALQSHYLGLLLIPVIGTFWLLAFIENRKLEIGNFYRYTIYSAVAFALLMSPLIIFDARHEWRNFDAIKKFFLERQTTVSARPWNALPKAWPLIQKLSTRIVAGRAVQFGQWVAVGLSAVLLWIGGLNKVVLKSKEKKAYLLIITWLGFAILGLGLYKQEIYDHYYGFFFAAPFLLIGGMAQHLIDNHKLRGTWVVATAMVFLVYFNLLENPLKYPPNQQLRRSREVAQKILYESNDERFNLAVIAERNYEDAYQYYLEKWEAPVIDIDAQKAGETITDQLFVVCEMIPEKCDPTHNPKAQVAQFGWSEIENEWEVFGARLYKLKHVDLDSESN